ncbi:hypothetical protein H0H93_004929 [Arthromyces matolae]|nr:hypothetical protein H0H93_004929 [Arthromyces matolae]
MSKRELEQLSGAPEIEGPRTKRRRETIAVPADADAPPSDPATEPANENDVDGAEADLRELGLKLYETVRDAVNKEGRTLSLAFLRRPPKRQYPDYYQIIQQPIAFEDIKKRLDSGTYQTLDAVKHDFELCFNNAKQYNLKESEIWRDAKDLAKLVNKTYNKLVPSAEIEGAEEGEIKKSKPPSLSRLIKSRLQKLIDKADDTGRLLSREFMELPSKKEWPSYYKQIKRPQCLENIFKRIKRKEYTSSSDFAADVELVFENAMTFNQEHTLIWEDAKALRDYFRLLVADLPPPFDIPHYAVAKPKIKIKPQPSSLLAATGQSTSTSTSQTLRIPAVKHAKASPVSTPTTPVVSLPAVSSSPPQVTEPVAQNVQVPPVTASHPVSYVNPTFSHYPNASYSPPASVPAATTTITSTSNLATANPINQIHSSSNSPVPVPHSSRLLKSISLVMQPRGRLFTLDYEDGVKCWSLTLVPGETEIHISQVAFMAEEEDESSGEGEDEDEDEEEGEDPSANGRKRGRGRGRGRPKGTTKAKVKAAAAKKKKPKIGPVQVKVNGIIVKEQENENGQWVVTPAVGTSTMEVGENGGLIWKVYVQRTDYFYDRTLQTTALSLDPVVGTESDLDFRSSSSRSGKSGRDGLNSRANSGTWESRKSSASSDLGWGIPQQKSAQGQPEKPRSFVKQGASPSTSTFPDSGWGPSGSKSKAPEDTRHTDLTGWDNDPGHSWGAEPVEGRKGKGKDETFSQGKPTDVLGGWGSLRDKGRGSVAEGANAWTTNPLNDPWSSSAWGENSPVLPPKEITSGWNTSSNTSSSTISDPRLKTADPRRTLASSRSTDRPKETFPPATQQSKEMPSVTPRRLPLAGSKDLSHHPKLHSTVNDGASALKIKTKGIECADPMPSSVPASASARDSPLSRSETQEKTIRYTIQAVRLRTVLDQALKEVETLKRWRTSTQFNRATPQTQDVLRVQRSNQIKQIKDLEIQCQTTIKYLSELPYFTTRHDLLSAKAGEHDLAEYVAQLEKWIQHIKHRHQPPPISRGQISSSATAPEQPKHPREIIWDEIDNVVQTINDEICVVEDVLYHNRPVPLDVGTKIEAILNDRSAKQMSGARQNAQSLSDEVHQLGEDSKELAEETAGILLTVHANGQVLGELKDELRDSDADNQRASPTI